MVSPLDLLKEQMRISRERGIEILEGCFRGISNPSEISERVRDFYLRFALEAEQSKNAEMAWTELLGSGCAEYVSYYRIDSYLLADAPFTLRSPIFFLRTTTLENGTTTLDYAYYGVEAEGLELLIENFLAWPVADDIQNYPDDIKKFIEGLNKNPPLYAHCFEVSLATYWLKNIINKSSLNANCRRIADNFQKGDATYLNFLLNVYYPCKTERVRKLKQVIERIPPEPSGGAPPLNYSNLQETTKEMLMRVSLFSEVLSHLTKIEWVQLDKVLRDLENILENQQLNNAQRKKKVSEYVYKFWQIYGTPWSYSRGGTTDFSLRDLSPSGLREAQPQKTEEPFKIPTFSKFKQIVEGTNIDDANNRGKRTQERKELLENLVKAAKKEIDQHGAPWMLISYIGPLARAYEKRDQQKIEKIENIREKITELLKGARGEAIGEPISGVAIHLAIHPIISGVVGPILATLSSIVLLGGESRRLHKKLESYQITGLDVHYSHIFSDQVQLQYIPKNPRFRMAIVNLPYQRKGCQFSGRSLNAIGYRELRQNTP